MRKNYDWGLVIKLGISKTKQDGNATKAEFFLYLSLPLIPHLANSL